MGTTKKCFKCTKRKDFSQFYSHPQMADGLLGKCKECTRRDVRNNYRKRVQHVRAYKRSRMDRPEVIERTRERRRVWSEENPLKVLKSRSDYNKRNLERRRAHFALRRAILAGRVVRPTVCSQCEFRGEVHGHHADYSLPLSVEWLCPACHGKAHRREVDMKYLHEKGDRWDTK